MLNNFNSEWNENYMDNLIVSRITCASVYQETREFN